MWLFTDLGFFSVVTHRDDADTLVVRARVRDDLEALRDAHLPDIEIVETPGRDYRWRALVAREDWARAVAAVATAIDYPNFKNVVAERQGVERARRYGKVWGMLYEFQRDQG